MTFPYSLPFLAFPGNKKITACKNKIYPLNRDGESNLEIIIIIIGYSQQK